MIFITRVRTIEVVVLYLSIYANKISYDIFWLLFVAQAHLQIYIHIVIYKLIHWPIFSWKFSPMSTFANICKYDELLSFSIFILILLTFSQHSVSAYRIWNDGPILMFKVSKWQYQSIQLAKIICKQCHYLYNGQKWN